ncbi:MAG: cysteine desulfurase [Saprospiraceae bacterium]|nr:cysteine desulfurase [Saprospiraceae bacterium]MBK9632844.1 cysteine desulfurase [Saprospiraceae bacterium]
MIVNQRIYFDHAATTPMSPLALAEMHKVGSELFANPSSIHMDGSKVKSYIEESRKIISRNFGVSASQLFFTSGGTEAINTVIRSLVMDQKIQNIFLSPIDHPAVINSVVYYAQYFKIAHSFLKTNHFGKILEEDLIHQLQNAKGQSLVCIIHTNNETGAIHDIESLCKVSKEYNAWVLADTVQSVGTMQLDFLKMGVDFACASAHKFNGPKAVGFLYASDPNLLKAFFMGGGQERNLRASTENIMGIAGMKIAMEEAMTQLEERKIKVLELHQLMRSELLKLDGNIQFNTPTENFHPKILSVHFDFGPHSEFLLMNLDIAGISASGGAACSSGSEKASHVLAHLRPGQTGKTIRFSLSHLNTKEEVQVLIDLLRKL